MKDKEITNSTIGLCNAITNYLIAKHFNVEDLTSISDAQADEYMSSQDFKDSFYKMGGKQIDDGFKIVDDYLHERKEMMRRSKGSKGYGAGVHLNNNLKGCIRDFNYFEFLKKKEAGLIPKGASFIPVKKYQKSILTFDTINEPTKEDYDEMLKLIEALALTLARSIYTSLCYTEGKKMGALFHDQMTSLEEYFFSEQFYEDFKTIATKNIYKALEKIRQEESYKIENKEEEKNGTK